MPESTDEAFWTATLYDACDSEEYEHSCPWEAVGEYLERNMDDNTVAELRRVCPVEVVAYRHAFPPHEELGQAAVRAGYEALAYLADGTYANPNEDVIDVRGVKRLESEIATAIMRALRDHGRLWHCEEVARRSFTFAEVYQQFGHECDDYTGEAKVDD